jgi:hypothetical protein
VITLSDEKVDEIREIVKNLDEIEVEIDKLIFPDDGEPDFDTAVEWMDSRVSWSEDLHLIMREVLR